MHTLCAHDAEPEWRCAHCGAMLEPRELQVRPGPGADAEQRLEPLLPLAPVLRDDPQAGPISPTG